MRWQWSLSPANFMSEKSGAADQAGTETIPLTVRDGFPPDARTLHAIIRFFRSRQGRAGTLRRAQPLPPGRSVTTYSTALTISAIVLVNAGVPAARLNSPELWFVV